MPSRRQVMVLSAAALTVSAARSEASERLIIFAAASLKTALDEVTSAWTSDTGIATATSYAASSALARQIEQGAPADVFLSADLDWMTYLETRGLVPKGSAIDLLGNSLVLISPRDSNAAITIAEGFPLAEHLGGGRLAMADVKSVPAGKYGKAALQSLGVWASVEGQLAQAENVRAALKLVATGEAPLGIVYATDAIADPAVKIIANFPIKSHPPIVYPVAPVSDSQNSGAASFITYLRSAKAGAIFVSHGFILLAAKTAN